MLVEYGSVFIILAIVLGLYMTWGIGANDVANAMGTSVGSGAITIKQAIIIAAIFEFAVLLLREGMSPKLSAKVSLTQLQFSEILKFSSGECSQLYWPLHSG